jgi:DNA repair protein RecO (recombination protein O)
VAGAPLQPCFVIHRRDYRNNSLLLELFTLELGRLPAIARGAKSGNSSKAALLQPFQPLRVGLGGRGEVKNLNQLEPEGRPFVLTGRLLYCGFYLNELLMRLLQRDDAHPDLFAYYLEVLAALSGGEPVDDWLRYFEVSLLRELGYELLLDREAESGDPLIPGRRYDYKIERGPLKTTATPGSSEGSIDGRTLLSLHNRAPMDVQAQREAKGLMRRMLAFYLGDKPLKSRELFQAFNQPQPKTRQQDG